MSLMKSKWKRPILMSFMPIWAFI